MDVHSPALPNADSTWKGRVRVVLVRPEHPGNIGAAARAMKNLGFGALHLVAPACGHLTPDALKMAYGAGDVLEGARLHPSLIDAVGPAQWVAGFGMARAGRPTRWLPEAGAGLAARSRADDAAEVALVFGPEISGLSNDDLAVCHQLIAIPTDTAQPSINLAQAVLLACYELSRVPTPPPASSPRDPATARDLDGLCAHLAETLDTIGFLFPPHDRHLVRDLRAIINRSGLDAREVRILRGILRQATWAGGRERGEPGA